MRRNEARIALEAARTWESRGMFKQGAFEHIEKELGRSIDQGGPSLAMQSFYAIGGVMLGAATAALYGLLQLNDVINDRQEVAWGFFAIWAFVLLGTAIGTHMVRQRELGDALVIAALVPTAILLGPDAPGTAALHGMPLLVGLGVVAWRWQAHLVPLVAFALANISLPVFLFRWLDSGRFSSDGLEAASMLWMFGAVALLATVLLLHPRVRAPWSNEARAGATLSVIAAWISVVVLIIEPDIDGGYEMVIALALFALIGLGILLKDPVITFVAGIALAIDAIVFAFNIGGPTTGLLVLMGMAGGLIGVATWLRRRRQVQPAKGPSRPA